MEESEVCARGAKGEERRARSEGRGAKGEERRGGAKQRVEGC